MKAKVDPDKCMGCAKCVDICPMDAIKMHDGKAVIGDECVACGACVSACPQGAISL